MINNLSQTEKDIEKLFKELSEPHNSHSQSEIHCQYCQCPIEVWKPFFKSYSGNECILYDDFTNVIWELEKAIRPFNNQDILAKCREQFEAEYTDIADFEVTVTEMITINVEEGYMPSNYRLLALCK